MRKLVPPDLYKFSLGSTYLDGERNFRDDAEEAFEFKHFPNKLKDRIHYLAYELGHSAGYYDMVTQYFDLVDLVKLAMEKELNEKQ